MLCLLVSANGYMPYPRAPCHRSMRSHERSVRHGMMMSLEIRDMQLADIADAAELLSRTFAPPDGYNPIQSAIVYKETVSGLTERLNQAHCMHSRLRTLHVHWTTQHTHCTHTLHAHVHCT